MDLKQMEYIVAIDKYKNMTEAAKNLFVTPSAISQQLHNLEDELGVSLFIRAKKQLFPTTEGRIFLDTAKQFLALRQSALSQLSDLADGTSGTYHIGLAVDHGSDVFARVYPRFHEIFPQVRLLCSQVLRVSEMIEKTASGEFDLSFVLSGTPGGITDEVSYLPISSENLLLGLPRSHPQCKHHTSDDRKPYSVIDLQTVKDDFFAVSLQKSTMRTQLIDPIFQTAGLELHVLIESSLNGFLEQLASSGICNTIIPQSCVRNWTDLSWFYLPGFPRFYFGVIYPKGYRLNHILSQLIEMVRQDAMQNLYFPIPGISGTSGL